MKTIYQKLNDLYKMTSHLSTITRIAYQTSNAKIVLFGKSIVVYRM